MLQITFIDNGTVASLQTIGRNVRNPRGLTAALVTRGKNELVAWFRQRNRTPNKLGGPRQNFWNAIASSTTSTVLSPTSGRISVTDYRFNQKLYGGRISPKTASALTIPVAPEAYGMTTKVFEKESGIELFRLKRSGGVLTNVLMGKLPSGDVKVFYVLAPFVDQAPDPDALPPREQFNQSLLDESRSYVTREIIRGAAPSS